MEAGEYGLTRGTWFFARCLEVVAVTGLLWILWCVLGGADFFFRVFQVTTFSNSYIQSSQRRLDEGLRQPANLPTDNSCPRIPTRCIV